GLAHAMRQQAKRGRIDVVQCHWLVPQAVVAALALRRNAPPFVITCHGSDLYGLNQRWLKALKRFALRRAAAVTTVSEPLKGEIRSLMGESEWPERTAVVSMGVDTERFAPSRRNPDWAPSKALGRPVVLFVGRLVEGKGVSFLIQALGNPVLAQTTVCAAIVGDGPQRQALEEQARYSGLGERIRFLGSVAHDALPEIYASCDIFCLPAIRTARGEEEGFGLVLAEAASSGLPIVAARVRGAQGLLEDGVTGSMVAERDPVALAKALSALASDAGLAARFGANARQQALKYDWQAIARRYRDLLACPCEM
ncbi:MAG TPA: glycosyltransferase, partial [Hyphomicrobiaceae bacterium]